MFFFSIPFFVFNIKCFPPIKGHFLFIFEFLPLFILSLFGPPLFSISLSLSLSHYLLLFVFLFPSCLSVLFFFLVPCFCLFLCFSVFFASVHERKNIIIFNCKVFHQSFLISCLVFSLKSLFSSLCFPDIELCFSFNINVFGFKKTKVKKNTPIFGQEGGCNQTFVLFMGLCFAKCEKSSFLFAFLSKFG